MEGLHGTNQFTRAALLHCFIYLFSYGVLLGLLCSTTTGQASGLYWRDIWSGKKKKNPNWQSKSSLELCWLFVSWSNYFPSFTIPSAIAFKESPVAHPGAGLHAWGPGINIYYITEFRHNWTVIGLRRAHNDMMSLYIAQLAILRTYKFNPCAGPRKKLSNRFIRLIWVAIYDIENHGRFSSNL